VPQHVTYLDEARCKMARAQRRGVLFVANLEVMDRDLRVLKRFGQLASDDPAAVGKDEFGDALDCLLDGLAKRFGVFGAGSNTPAKGSVQPAARRIRLPP
jgi:hypothetical protein